ncbi:MAG: ribosomal RNA small subunit methyltransferase A [Clostridia bacterium]|nr:ribosomal RNA small subunit methyltransferase A [Clostridia bacterium]
MRTGAKLTGPALKHSLGQNFILDPDLQRELARLTGLGENDTVLEIGAGSGMLTQALAEQVRAVTAVELDREMIPYLKAAVLSHPNVTVVQADILRFDWQAFAETHGDFHIAANLPYHVTTALLTQLTKLDLPILSMHLMLQKESAEKLCARAGEPGYGPLTLALSWRYEPEIRKYLPREAFTPPPRVDSAFISLTRREEPPTAVRDEQMMFDIIHAGFALRRKTLLNNLMNRYGLSRELTLAWLDSSGLSPTVRAEQIDIPGFAALADNAPSAIIR